MSAEYLGSLSVGAINVAAALALPILTENLAKLSALQAQLVQQIAANASLQVTLLDPAALLAQMIAAVEAMLATIASIIANAKPAMVSVGIDLGAQLAALVTLVLALESIVARIAGAISAGGIHAIAIDGTAGGASNDLASLIGSGLPGGGGAGAHVNALVLVTESPSAWAALSTLLRTS